jgi:hypothetical protein
MPSRYAKQKPDPAIKRNARRARARMQETKGEQALVAAASLAATILAWAALSLPNLGGTTPAPATNVDQLSATSVQNTASATIQATPTGELVPITIAPQGGIPSGAASNAMQVTAASSNVSRPLSITRTRSSR